MAILKMSSPWVVYYKEVEQLFKYDPEVRVIYNEETNVLTLYVDNQTKADALTQLLPTEKTFGGVILGIAVVPSNGATFRNRATGNLYQDAFRNNPILSYIKTIEGIFINSLTYVVFINEVVQYYNDSLADINGLCSTLYQEIAKDVFEPKEGIFFCTDVPQNKVSLGAPLGEWP